MTTSARSAPPRLPGAVRRVRVYGGHLGLLGAALVVTAA